MAALVVVEHGSSAPKAAAAAPSTSSSVSPRQAVDEWLAGNGPAEIRNLKRDYEGFTSDVMWAELSQAKDACGYLEADTQLDGETPPIPDPQAQADWAATISLFRQGGEDCVASTESLNADQGKTATGELQQADDDLTQTIARITALTGVTVS